MASSALKATLLADGVDEAPNLFEAAITDDTARPGIVAASTLIDDGSSSSGFGDGSYGFSMTPLFFYDTSSAMISEEAFYGNLSATLAGYLEINNASGNFSNADFDQPGWHLRYNVALTVILATLAFIVGVVTVLGNLLVLVAFIVDRTLRQPGNYLIVSLALADLLIGLFSMPLYTMYLLLDEKWPLGEIACDLWLSLDYTVCLVSQYTVFYITLDRFLVVKFTATYRLWLTNKRAKLIVTGIWIGSWLLFFPSITGWQYFVGVRTVPGDQCWAQFMENPLFNTILVILYYWMTLIVISILYTFIYHKAWQMENRRKAEHRRAQMVHIQLAQATLGLGAASSKSTAMVKGASKQIQNSCRMLRVSETTDDDDNKSSTSSHSISKRTGANKLTKNAVTLETVTGSPSKKYAVKKYLPPPRTNQTITSSNADISDCQNSNSSQKFVQANNSRARNNKKMKKVLEQKTSTFFNRNKDKKKTTTAKNSKNDNGIKKSVSHEQAPFLKPPSEEPVYTTDERSSPSKVGEDERAMIPTSPSARIRRSYSDLEPILSVSGLLHVPVNELVGIEFIDDDPETGEYNRQRAIGPFSGNTIYRIRFDPSLSRKSTTFENLTSARNEKTIRKRIDRLLKLTRRGVVSGLSFTSLMRRRRSSNKRRSTKKHESSVTAAAASESEAIADDATFVSNTNNNRPDSSSSSKHHHHPGGRKPFAGLNRGMWNNLTGSVSAIGNAVTNSGVKNSTTSNPRQSGVTYQSRAHKALRMISFILGVFVITWTPYHIFAIMKGFCNECVNDTLYAVSYWFCYLNSPINPICYAVANKHFKRAFAKILRGNFKRV